MSYTPYEEGEYPQIDDMYTENGERILINWDEYDYNELAEFRAEEEELYNLYEEGLDNEK